MLAYEMFRRSDSLWIPVIAPLTLLEVCWIVHWHLLSLCALWHMSCYCHLFLWREMPHGRILNSILVDITTSITSVMMLPLTLGVFKALSFNVSENLVTCIRIQGTRKVMLRQCVAILLLDTRRHVSFVMLSWLFTACFNLYISIDFTEDKYFIQ